MSRLALKAPAKVNLGLWVGKKRPDGFHEIVTIIVPLELHDLVEVMATHSGITATSNSPDVPQGPDNLAFKAAQRFFEAARINAGCRIHIRKSIPVGAGLGGGSSDAATVLTGLNRLFGKPLSQVRLVHVAREVGSDVPALLLGRACVARGRGERLRPVNLPRLNLVLHFPGYPVSTAWAYRALDRLRSKTDNGSSSQRHKGHKVTHLVTPSERSTLGRNDIPLGALGGLGGSPSGSGLTEPVLSPKILASRLRRGELERAARMVRNSFEPVVFRNHPDLAGVKQLMLENGCFAAALSGSGSTVYGLMEKARQDPMAALKRQGITCITTHSIQPIPTV